MNLFRLLKPKPTISEQDVATGLRWLTREGTVSLGFSSITTSGFLAAFALALGANNLQIGILCGGRSREEGKVGREVILESLFFPTRGLVRPMSSIPGYNLLANFPFGFLKRVPIPGIDIALGVTAYQIAEIARAATLAAVSGRRLTQRLVKLLDTGLAGIWQSKEEVKMHGVEIARQAARGAMRATSDGSLAVEDTVVPVTTGVAKVTSQAGVDSLDGISGASQGVLEGAIETEADVGAVIGQMVQATKKVAAQSRLSEEAALAQATKVILETTESLGTDALTMVKEALEIEVSREESKEPVRDI